MLVLARLMIAALGLASWLMLLTFLWVATPAWAGTVCTTTNGITICAGDTPEETYVCTTDANGITLCS